MVIYKNFGVKNAIIDIDNDEADFVVRGSTDYKVRIIGFVANNIFASCSCPFDWGTICKHAVAALLYLDNRDFERPTTKQRTVGVPKETNKRKRANEPYLITDHRHLTEEYVFSNLPFGLHYQLRYNSYNIELTSISDNKIVYLVNDYYSSKNVTVELSYKNGNVHSKTNQNKTAQKLTIEEACVLNYIAKTPSPGYLHFHFSGEKEKHKTDFLKDFGFGENANFDDYFKMELSPEKGLTIYPKDNARGILPVNENYGHNYFDLLKTLAKDNSGHEINIAKKENRALAFALICDRDEDGYAIDANYELIAIKGKTNKQNTKLVSNIGLYEYLQSNEHVQINENQKELLEFCGTDSNDSIAGLNNWKQVFELLGNEKFVFASTNGKYRIRKKDLMPLITSNSYVDIEFNVVDSNELIELQPVLIIESKKYSFADIDRFGSDYYLLHINGVLHVNSTVDVCDLIQSLDTNIQMHSSHKELFYSKVIEPLSRKWNLNTDNTDHFKIEKITLSPQKKQVYLSEQGDFLIIKPHVVYDQGITCALTSSSNMLREKEGVINEYIREPGFEKGFLDFISSLHPDFSAQSENNIFYLSPEQLMENHWFFGFFDKLQSENIEVFGLKELKNFKYSPYKAQVKTSVSSGQDWFDVDVEVSFGDTLVSLNDIRKAVIKKQKYIQLKDGSVGILPEEWLNKLNKYFRNGEIKKDKLKISKLRFSIVDELFDNIDDELIIKELHEKRNRLKQVTEIKNIVVPRAIKAKLRPYQKEGLNWLHFLDEMKWGGILADDMGLGKTLQILAFISKKKSKKTMASLIVVPTTLLFNWQNEIAKFAPGLKAFYHYGSNREKDTGIFSNYDIVFTTYGILVRDIEILKSHKFDYVILDESQAIKNPGSQRYKAVNVLNANNRLALTGTPIENSTFDLFAQMTFVNPGFLGSMKSFKENYSNAIDKEGDQKIAAELQKIISSFILRRTKEQVASELPPKTEDVIYCEMEGEQRKIYDAFRNDYRNKLLSRIEEDGLAKSKIFVLEGLMKLRQICDSPALLKDDDIDSGESVKIKELVRYITDKTANHKILIFSQFTSMLSLIKQELHNNGIEYEYLDGKCSIKQRKASVQHFQEDEKLRVFLISLKAGGTGLNLTAADYVFIVDPWWNPAVEEQAIDRCYRIGQDKKVFAYRMICKDTIEEKITKLQAKKKKISGDLIKVDDESIMKGLKTVDIEALFS